MKEPRSEGIAIHAYLAFARIPSRFAIGPDEPDLGNERLDPVVREFNLFCDLPV